MFFKHYEHTFFGLTINTIIINSTLLWYVYLYNLYVGPTTSLSCKL